MSKPKQSLFGKLTSPFRQKRELKSRITKVVRTNGVFGFSIKGGVENDLLPTILLSPTTNFVCSVGTLHMGDELVAVNGVNVAGEPHERVVELIHQSGDVVELELLDAPNKAAKGHKLSMILKGKGSKVNDNAIVARIREAMYEYAPPVTSRPRRPDEVEGREYHFVSREEFKEYIKANDLVEYGINDENGHYYGTLRLTREAINNHLDTAQQSGLLQVYAAVLSRDGAGEFGLSFAGGLEQSVLPYVDGISMVQPNAGSVQVGDSVLSIDGHFTSIFTLDEMARVLDEAGDTVELVLLRGVANVSLDDIVAIQGDKSLDKIKADMVLELYDTRVPFTTRMRREIEVDGVDYNFVSLEVFHCLQSQLKFAEWGEKDNTFYGTCASRAATTVHFAADAIVSSSNNNTIHSSSSSSSSSVGEPGVAGPIPAITTTSAVSDCNVLPSPVATGRADAVGSPRSIISASMPTTAEGSGSFAPGFGSPSRSSIADASLDFSKGLGRPSINTVTITRPTAKTPFGITFGTNAGGLLAVATIDKGSPADVRALSAGLTVAAINGNNVVHSSPAEANAILASAGTSALLIVHRLSRQNTASHLFPGRVATTDISGETSRSVSSEHTKQNDSMQRLLLLAWILAILAVVAAYFLR